MRFSAALLVATALGLTQAFSVPNHLEDGLWATDGSGAWQKLAEPSPPSKMMRSAKISQRAPLPKGDLGCTTNGLVYSDLASAQYSLEDYCGSSNDVPSKKHLTYVKGNAAAYVCNYAGKNTCAAAEAQAAFASLGGNCGTLSAPLGGSYFLKDWGKTYGYDLKSALICTNGA